MRAGKPAEFVDPGPRYTREQLQKEYQVGKDAVTAWIEAGLVFSKPPNSREFFFKRDVDEFLWNHRTTRIKKGASS